MTAGSPTTRPRPRGLLVEWARKTHPSERTGRDYAETVQVAEELVRTLPAAEADPLRKTLAGLRVASFVVRAVVEGMRYDVPRLVAPRGKPIEITFETPSDAAQPRRRGAGCTRARRHRRDDASARHVDRSGRPGCQSRARSSPPRRCSRRARASHCGCGRSAKKAFTNMSARFPAPGSSCMATRRPRRTRRLSEGKPRHASARGKQASAHSTHSTERACTQTQNAERRTLNAERPNSHAEVNPPQLKRSAFNVTFDVQRSAFTFSVQRSTFRRSAFSSRLLSVS